MADLAVEAQHMAVLEEVLEEVVIQVEQGAIIITAMEMAEVEAHTIPAVTKVIHQVLIMGTVKLM